MRLVRALASGFVVGSVAGVYLRIRRLERDRGELIEAIRLTQEYVQLPALAGWTWYDALRKHDPVLLRLMLHPPQVHHEPLCICRVPRGGSVVIEDGRCVAARARLRRAEQVAT